MDNMKEDKVESEYPKRVWRESFIIVFAVDIMTMGGID